jgi:hypothetical protein
MSDSGILDFIHLFSNKTLSVEDQPQKDPIIQPSGIANLYLAHPVTFTVDQLKRRTLGV